MIPWTMTFFIMIYSGKQWKTGSDFKRIICLLVYRKAMSTVLPSSCNRSFFEVAHLNCPMIPWNCRKKKSSARFRRIFEVFRLRMYWMEVRMEDFVSLMQLRKKRCRWLPPIFRQSVRECHGRRARTSSTTWWSAAGRRSPWSGPHFPRSKNASNASSARTATTSWTCSSSGWSSTRWIWKWKWPRKRNSLWTRRIARNNFSVNFFQSPLTAVKIIMMMLLIVTIWFKILSIMTMSCIKGKKARCRTPAKEISCTRQKKVVFRLFFCQCDYWTDVGPL